MDNNTTEPNENNDNQHSWIHTILSIPTIGGFLTFVVAIAPAILILLAFSPFFLSEESEKANSSLDTLLAFVVPILLLLITWWWLHYLERKIQLGIMLPIPFINIPVKWILYPFMLPFFGLQKIYRHFVPKDPIVEIESITDLEGDNEL